MRTLGDALFFWSWTGGGGGGKAGAETIELDVKHSPKDATGARAGGVTEKEATGRRVLSLLYSVYYTLSTILYLSNAA